MPNKKKKIMDGGLRQFVFVLIVCIVLLLGASAISSYRGDGDVHSATAYTFTSKSSDVFYFDDGSSLTGLYVAYEIINTSAVAETDVWAKVDSLSGPNLSLATNEDGLYQLGAMPVSETKMAYFYLQTAATADVAVSETFTVRLYPSESDAQSNTNQIDSEIFTISSQDDTAVENNNKVNSAVISANPPAFGSEFTITVTGQTGNLGNNLLSYFSPATQLNWLPDAFRLLSSEITLEYGAGTGDDVVFMDQLAITLPSATATDYTAVYTFKSVEATTSVTPLSPTAFVNRRKQELKHTQDSVFSGLTPVGIVTGPVPDLSTSTKIDDDIDDTVAPGQRVGFTVTVRNTGGVTATGVDIDDTIDVNFENLGNFTFTNCGGSYFNNSTASVVNINGLEVLVGTDCVITYELDVKPGLANGVTLDNQVVISPAPEGGSGAGPSSDTLTVSALPDLSTSTKVEGDLDDIVFPGDVITYTITIINTGVSNATGVDVDDTIDTKTESLGNFTFTNCGSTYSNASTSQKIDVTGLEVLVATNCIVTFDVLVKSPVSNGASIENAITISPAAEGGSGANPSSDTLTAQNYARVFGRIWHDEDEDGSQNGLELGIFNVTLDLYEDSNGNGILEGGEPLLNVVSTDPDGDYEFTDLFPGDYMLKVSDSNGVLAAYELIETNENPVAATGLSYGDDLRVIFSYRFAPEPEGGRKRGAGGATVVVETGELDEDVEPIEPSETEPGEETEEDLKPAAEPEDEGCVGIPDSQVCSNMQVLFEEDETNIRDLDLCTDDPLINLQVSGDECLQLDVDDSVEFENIFVETLKNTKTKGTFDYALDVFTPEGEFNEDSFARRIDLVRAALVANCMPIEKDIPIPPDGFEFADLSFDVDQNDGILYEAAQIFYTAYKYGLVSGYEGAYADPFGFSRSAEAISLLLKAAHAIPSDYSTFSGPWYARYMSFAHNNGILNGIENVPDDYLTKGDLAKIVLRIMAYNPKPEIYGYIERVDLAEQVFNDDLPIHQPLPDLRSFEIKPAMCLEDISDTCLDHNPDRRLRFTDLPKDHFAYPYVEILKNSRVKNTGDYIINGDEAGREFHPDKGASRLEVFKLAMMSNCLPIADEIPVPFSGFKFRDLSVHTTRQDPDRHYAARVMYSAYIHGLISSDRARPFDTMNRMEALSLLTKASGVVPLSYKEEFLPFTDLIEGAWYRSMLSYTFHRGVVSGFSDGTFKGDRLIKRSEMVKIAVHLMAINEKRGISNYIQELVDYYALDRQVKANQEIVEVEESRTFWDWLKASLFWWRD